jgi:hypothetical protein
LIRGDKGFLLCRRGCYLPQNTFTTPNQANNTPGVFIDISHPHIG